MNLSLHDLLWLMPTALTLLNGWQGTKIQAEILKLKLDLVERITGTEKNVAVLQSQQVESSRSTS